METRARLALGLAALVLAALSFGPSYAHLLEAPPRLNIWSPELWRETTVFNQQFRLFASVGAPIEILVILATAAHAWVLRRERPAFPFALAGAMAFAAALAIWFLWVAPANAVLATWQPGPIPANFDAVRTRWESGHIVIAVVKLAGLLSVAASILVRLPRRGRSGTRAASSG